MKILNLENTRLKDKGAIIVFDSLKNNVNIKSLNISQNELSDGLSDRLYNFLTNTKSIEIMYLHWNQLKL